MSVDAYEHTLDLLMATVGGIRTSRLNPTDRELAFALMECMRALFRDDATMRAVLEEFLRGMDDLDRITKGEKR